MGHGTQLDDAGWRQGSIVKLIDHESLAPHTYAINDGDRLIVIMQSCDIIKEPDQAEPFIELIIARSIDKLDGNFTHNKNPRKLHLTIQTTSGDYPASIIQQEKLLAPRPSFIGLYPDEDVFLERHQIGNLARWLASRYQRPAFPNTFNNRIAKIANANKKLDNAAKKISSAISGLYVQILPLKELDEGENYAVNILALVPAGQDIDLKSKAITDPINAIANIMKAAQMEVVFKIETEDKVPYSLFRNDFKPWSFDHLSLRHNPAHNTPID